MATSFPSSRQISPSVRIEERDFSQYDVGATSNTTALVGFAAKGPINLPTQIRNTEELFRIFGQPDPDMPSYLIYSAIDYLREGNDLWIVRVGQDDPGSDDFARTAFVDIPSGGPHAQLVTTVSQQTWSITPVNTLTLATPRYIRIRCNGTPYIRELVIPAGTVISKLCDDAYSGTSLESILAAQLTTDDGFYVTHCGPTDDRRLVFRSRIGGTESSIEIVSSRYNIYSAADTAPHIPSNNTDTDTDVGGLIGDITLHIGRNMTSPSILGTENSYNSSNAGEWLISGHRNLRLEVMVFGTGDTSVDGVIQNIYLPADDDGNNTDVATTQDMVDWLNGVASGSEAINAPRGFWFVADSNQVRIRAGYVEDVEADPTKAWYLTGIDAKLIVRPTSTADAIFGMSNLVHAGTNPVGAIASHPTACLDPLIDTSWEEKVNTSTVTGSEATSTVYTMRVWASTPGTEGNNTQVTFEIDPETGLINLYVDHRGIRVENWTALHNDPNDTTDTLHYIENYINGFSDYIMVEDDTLVIDLPAEGTYNVGSTTVGAPEAGTNGIPDDPADQATLIIGSNVRSTGLYSLSEPERIEIDLVAVPGVSTTSVIQAEKYLCETLRQDCMFIVDPPFGMTPLEVRKWHNGQHPLNNVKFNSNYGALYWPWIKEYDGFNQVEVYTPPSGSVLAIYARTDKVAWPWMAPAGLRRGIIDWAIETEYVPYLRERDSLYMFDNAVNTIANFPNYGIVVWGQKTLQRRPTALDRVNVRRLMLYVEKTIKERSHWMIFEPHDSILRDEFIRMAHGVLVEVINNRGAYDAIIVCDDTLNTQEVMDRNELRARIGIQPAKAVEFVYITFTVHRTGSFETSVYNQNTTRSR